MSASEEPMLSRLNRLDNILRQLEDFRGDHHSPKSSSYTSSGVLTSEGRPSFATDFSPERLEKHCRPVSEVLLEVEQKGTLIERLVHAEDRILKLCLQLEEEFEGERSRELRISSHKNSPKKSLKQLVKSCVPRKSNHKKQLAS
ncbi:hypothetical protein ACS0TY_003231 [Phlomoides rotata]